MFHIFYTRCVGESSSLVDVFLFLDRLTMMIENSLIHTGIDWRAHIEKLRANLELLQNDLIEAEAQLAERMAAINAFEFELRAKLEPFTRQLEVLEAKIREEFSRLEREWHEQAGEEYPWQEEGAAASGEYRYHAEDLEAKPQVLDEDETAEIKRLYRQLARRFHPDMALDDADREYRTQLMMAINAAYTVGDVDKLRELALSPDLGQHMDNALTDQQLAEALEREIGRVQRRLQEVNEELEQLAHHRSTKLMQRKQKAEAAGRDFYGQMIQEIREKILQKEMDLEWLMSEEAKTEGMFFDDEFDDGLMDDEPSLDRWKRGIGLYGLWDDDILDDSD